MMRNYEERLFTIDLLADAFMLLLGMGVSVNLLTSWLETSFTKAVGAVANLL